jgi:hypothetical protein
MARADGGAGGARRLWLVAALGLPALGLAASFAAWWPGIMIDDARWQYQQAIDGEYDDWHPPLMAWIWHLTMRLMPGPGPMLALQLLLYWGGIALVAMALWRRGRPATAAALACAGWLPAPLLFLGTVLKDVLVTGCLAVATGLVLRRGDGAGPRAGRWLAAGAVLALVAAAALRFNAFLACAPLLAVLAGPRFRRTRLRLAATGVTCVAALMLVMPTLDALIGARRSDVGLSLILFDLGGITEESGRSQFPAMSVADPVAANHRCYDRAEWDGYSSWAKAPCRLGFDPFRAAVERQRISPVRLSLGAVAAHPVAYARHRLGHFNLATWFLVPAGTADTGWDQSDPNPWNYRVPPNTLLRAVQSLGDGVGDTPLLWPFFWIALAAAAFVLAAGAKLEAEIVALALSAFLYGGGYLLLGVATSLRYHLWTVTGAALAAILVADALARAEARAPRGAWVAAAAVLLLPTAAAIGARWTLAG